MTFSSRVRAQSITLRQNAESEFDGGDSGSGVVGDGNVDLEDQHNSATLGGNRGGIADVGSASMAVGRGNVIAFDPEDNQPAAKGATTARTPCWARCSAEPEEEAGKAAAAAEAAEACSSRRCTSF
jgi:hypothetical protein